MPKNRGFSFGPFVLDLVQGHLFRDGMIVETTPKVFGLLLYLLENRGRLIAKEELIEKLWPDTIVSEGSLTRAIANLRSALGDDPEKPRWIETAIRRGYRFMGPVTDDGPAQSPGPARQAAKLCYLRSGARNFELREGENFIGRADDCHISIKSPSVSRQHARIVVAGSDASIEDLGSRNGTYVGDIRIEGTHPLRSGDQIRCGTVPMKFWTPSGFDETLSADDIQRNPSTSS